MNLLEFMPENLMTLTTCNYCLGIFLKQSKAKDKFKTEPIDITPYQEALDDEYQKIQDWGLEDYADKIKNGTIQSVFGNVDMDKRTIITWSDELKQTYADALASWDYDPEVGSIDTVFGGSSRFGEELNQADEAYICDFPENAQREEGVVVTIDDLKNKLTKGTLISEDEAGAKFLASRGPAVYLFMSSKDIYKLKNIVKSFQ